MNAVMTRRLGLLLDPGSFVLHGETDDGEILGGTGTIDGRLVCVLACNPMAGVRVDPFDSLQEELALLDLAEREEIPLIHLADRPGRVAMETTAIPFAIIRTFIDRQGAGQKFARFARLSGIVPRVAVVFRPIATTLTFPVASCDAVVMLEEAGMSLARPDMMRLMVHDSRPYEEYGGSRMHAEISGTCDLLAASEADALAWVRRYVGYFPSSFRQAPPRADPADPAPDSGTTGIPDDLNVGFETRRILDLFVDEGSLLEHRAGYAGEIITAFARVEGKPLGIIASNSAARGRTLFPASCRKPAAFASPCNAFNLPLVFLADTPGFMVGKDAEQAAVIHHGALIFSVLATLDVPHLCIVMRKAYTAGYYAMGGAGFGPDRILAMPGAAITIYGIKAVDLLAEDQHLSPEQRTTLHEFAELTTTPSHYLSEGHIDGIITPEDLRLQVRQFLERSYEHEPDRATPRRVLCI